MKLDEDGVAVIGGTPANNVGGGAVAGLGVESPSLQNQAEPGANKKNKKKILSFKEMLARKLP